MSFDPGLSPDDYQVTDPILTALGEERGWGVGSTEHLISEWTALVQALEEEYRLEVYEYENELNGRQILEVLVPRLPPPLALRVREVLEPWDRRFNEATVPVNESLCTPTLEEPGPWCYRAPKRFNEEVASSLQQWLRGGS